MLRQRPNVSSSSGTTSATTSGMDIPISHHSEGKHPPSYSTITSEPPHIAEPNATEPDMDLSNLSRKSQWIVLAVASGACAAFNGVFAKLTTTELTTNIASSIASLLGLGSGAKAVEVVIRGMFFALNLIFNGVMWTLFTKALARGTSTTQVSIINTSSNFMITAILGFFIFTESLPPLWWAGAALLVVGNVIIGRREEKDVDADGPHHLAENGESSYSEEEEGGLLGESVELTDELEVVLKRGSFEEDDLLDLEDEREERSTVTA